MFLNASYGYDVRCELVGELGTVALGDGGDVILRKDGRRSGRVPADWIERFARAYDVEVQAWIDSVIAGQSTGPSAWDGYAATAVAESCLQALERGERTAVQLVERPAFYR